MILAAEASSNDALTVAVAALAISLAALLFAVLSFWWLNARRGRLLTWRPLTYAGVIRGDSTLITLPLVLYNAGPAPIIVHDLRLTIGDVPMWWSNLREGLHGERFNEVSDHASGFAVSGRATEKRFLEFKCNITPLAPDSVYRCRIDAQTNRRGGRWSLLVEFDLVTMDEESAAVYVPHPTAGLSSLY